MDKPHKDDQIHEEPELHFSFPVDKSKIEQIHKCLEKGRLTVKVSKIDSLHTGRGVNGYTYD